MLNIVSSMTLWEDAWYGMVSSMTPLANAWYGIEHTALGGCFIPYQAQQLGKMLDFVLSTAARGMLDIVWSTPPLAVARYHIKHNSRGGCLIPYQVRLPWRMFNTISSTAVRADAQYHIEHGFCLEMLLTNLQLDTCIKNDFGGILDTVSSMAWGRMLDTISSTSESLLFWILYRYAGVALMLDGRKQIGCLCGSVNCFKHEASFFYSILFGEGPFSSWSIQYQVGACLTLIDTSMIALACIK